MPKKDLEPENIMCYVNAEEENNHGILSLDEQLKTTTDA